MGEHVTRPSFFTPSRVVDLSQAWKSVVNFLLAGLLMDWKYVQHPSCPTNLSAGSARNSSSEIEKLTTGQLSAVRPAAAYSLKKGTLVSPLSVLMTQALPPAANCLISATIC